MAMAGGWGGLYLFIGGKKRDFKLPELKFNLMHFKPQIPWTLTYFFPDFNEVYIL